MRHCEICNREIPWREGDYPKRYEAKRFCGSACVNKSRRQYADEQTCNREYRQRHLEKLKARRKEFYIQNKDKEQAQREKWRANNPDYHSQWKKDNAVRTRIHEHNRRTRIKENGGSFTPQEWEEKLKAHNYQCAMCGIHNEKSPLTMDHIIAVSKGGRNDISNIQPLCSKCNCKKFVS